MRRGIQTEMLIYAGHRSMRLEILDMFLILIVKERKEIPLS